MKFNKIVKFYGVILRLKCNILDTIFPQRPIEREVENTILQAKKTLNAMSELEKYHLKSKIKRDFDCLLSERNIPIYTIFALQEKTFDRDGRQMWLSLTDDDRKKIILLQTEFIEYLDTIKNIYKISKKVPERYPAYDLKSEIQYANFVPILLIGVLISAIINIFSESKKLTDNFDRRNY